MGSDDLRLELVSGNSDRPVVCLRPGEPMDPLSMGRLGYWRILARGVADVHAFVYFDGEGVFVASADPSQPAYINRTPVRGEWTEILPPCEIRFGEAVISLRGRPPSQLAVSSAYAAPQGGAWQASAEMDFDDVTSPDARPQRMQKPRIDVAEDDAEPTRVAPDGSQPVQRRRRRKPKIRVPSPEEATLIRPLDEMESSSWNQPPAAGAPQPWSPPAQYPPEVRGLTPPPGVAPYAQPAQLMPPPGVMAMPAPPPGVAIPAPPPGVTAPAVAPIPPGFMPPGVGPQPGFGQAPVPQSSVETQLVKAQKPSRIPPALLPHVNKALEAWKSSSVPQKIILVLLPLAFVAIFVVFTDEEPKRTGTKPKGSASAAQIASAPPSASAAPTTPPVADTPPPASVAAVQTAQPAATSKPAGTPPGKTAPKTIERQAADAVIAGSYNEAIGLYEQLAKEHPDQPVYKESIRILRAKLSENH